VRNIAGKWLAATAIVAVGGLLISVAPAIAAEIAPASTTQTLNAQHQARAGTPKISGVQAVPNATTRFHICLANSRNYCIQTNGTGNQVTITSNSADKGNFTLVRSLDGGILQQYQDGNGNCLREGTGDVVKIENGGCSSGDDTAKWDISNGNGNYLVNYYYNGYMLTRGTPASGDKVFAYSALPPGVWDQWTFITS
jgi:hypothetical protein